MLLLTLLLPLLTLSSDWPCPLAEDIAPCLCEHQEARISLLCRDVAELADIQRIFSQQFPFPDMGK